MISGMVQTLGLYMGLILAATTGIAAGIYYLIKHKAEQKLEEIMIQIERRHK